MMNKYHTAGTATCYKISSGWQHKPFWWRAKWECTFLLIQEWDLTCSRNCVHYFFFSSSHWHFYSTSQSSDVAPRIPQEYSPTSHMQLMKKIRHYPTDYFEKISFYAASPYIPLDFVLFVHSTLESLWQVHSLHISVDHWFNASIKSYKALLKNDLPSSSVCFQCFCITKRTRPWLARSHCQKDSENLALFLLTLHSIQITKIHCQLFAFIRHEIHWVQNLHRFQLMNKL